jgi:hypothetical protein
MRLYFPISKFLRALSWAAALWAITGLARGQTAPMTPLSSQLDLSAIWHPQSPVEDLYDKGQPGLWIQSALAVGADEGPAESEGLTITTADGDNIVAVPWSGGTIAGGDQTQESSLQISVGFYLEEASWSTPPTLYIGVAPGGNTSAMNWYMLGPVTGINYLGGISGYENSIGTYTVNQVKVRPGDVLYLTSDKFNEYPAPTWEAYITNVVQSATCASCSSGTCSAVTASNLLQIGSVDAEINLGKDSMSEVGGAIDLIEEDNSLGEGIYSPAALNFVRWRAAFW